MKEYHKINTIWKRNERGQIMEGEYADDVFAYLAGNKWVFTEKVDGTNIRVMWENGGLRFGGKTDNAQMPVFLMERLQAMFDAPDFEAHFGTAKVCLYGEGYGAKIQKGGGNYKPDGVDFVLFDVWVDGIWLRRESVEDVGAKMNVRVVPSIGDGTLAVMCDVVRNGFDSQWGAFKAEGIVARPECELLDRRGHRVITKLKCKDFAK